jgi:ethanolamine utilization protein EutA (predicted chaperonin)
MWVLILKDEAGQRHAHVDSAFSGIAETIKTEESDVYVLADIGQILTPALKQMKDEVEAK